MQGKCYEAFGLLIGSDGELPNLQTSLKGGPVDIYIAFEHYPQLASFLNKTFYRTAEIAPSGLPWLTVWRLPDGGYHIRFSDNIQFTVDAAGTRIWSADLAGDSLVDAATYLFGFVMALALNLRAIPCLHASAVEVNGRAVVFAGPSGAGKSSLATVFATSGFRVLTDDVVAIQRQNGGFLIPPAFPALRLRPDFVLRHFGDVFALPLITPNWYKQELDLSSSSVLNYADQPLAPTAIYILIDSTLSTKYKRFELLSIKEAMLVLSDLAYHSMLLDRQAKRIGFEAFADLASALPTRWLPLLEDPEQLPELVDQIVANVSVGQGVGG